MPFFSETELDLVLSDCGDPITVLDHTISGRSERGLVNREPRNEQGYQTADMRVTIKRSALGDIARGSVIDIDGTYYTVKSAPVTDGDWAHLDLSEDGQP